MFRDLCWLCVLGFTFLPGGAFATDASVSGARVVSSAKAPRHALGKDGSEAQLFLNPSVGAAELALTVLYLKPGASVPPHRHPKSAEAIYIQSGRVQMVIEGRRLTAEAGDVVYIPAGEQHSAKVLPGQALKAIQVYVGPGPEQRFRKGTQLPHDAP